MARQPVTDSLDLVLSVEWPFAPLVEIPPEELPRVAMHIARAFRQEAQRWEQQAFLLAAEPDTSHHLAPVARPSVPVGDQGQKHQVWGTD
jgi:hypothetical protein